MLGDSDQPLAQTQSSNIQNTHFSGFEREAAKPHGKSQNLKDNIAVSCRPIYGPTGVQGAGGERLRITQLPLCNKVSGDRERPFFTNLEAVERKVY